MKKICIFLIFIILFPIKVNALSSECAIVMDSDSNRVLFGKNIYKQKLIASTSKIMTAIVTIENTNIDKKIKVTDEVLKAYGSAIYIEVGEELTIKDLLYGLLLRSGNDAAIMLAKEVSGSMEEFVKLMNNKAHELNMNNTIFYNSHGLEENNGVGNTSTAYDMALLGAYAIKNETFKQISSTKEITVKTSLKTYSWNNKNKLLNMYKYTVGGKTGYTEKAKRTLVTMASKDNKNLVIVTLNDGNDFNNHQTLYESYFDNYDLVYILDKNNFKVNPSFQNYYLKQDFKMLLKPEEKNNIDIKYEIEENKDGVAKVYYKDYLIHEEKVYYSQNKKSHKIKTFFQKLLFWIKHD